MMIRPLGALVLLSFFALPLRAASLDGRTIIVDAGHGTINLEGRLINGGKETWDKVPEHQLTLEIAEKVAHHLKKRGARVYATRDQKGYWRPAYNSVDDNKERASFANQLKGDALLSIHCDWHPSRAIHGVTTIYAKRNSHQLGDAIHQRMVKRLKAKDRRVVKDRFTILDHAEMPAVIIETGFMSHAKEGRKLKSRAYQEKIAQAITEGVVRYFTSR